MGTAYVTALCELGAPGGPACAYGHVAERIAKGRKGDRSNRLCPCHDDHEASLSINPGTEGVRTIWHCHAGCHPADVRAALLDLGVDESCLGTYGIPKEYRTVVPGMHVSGHGLLSPGTVADAKRWQAFLKLPKMVSPKMHQVCVQAIIEGDGDLPGDPERLLPTTREEFVALAARAGIARAYRYKLFDDRCRGVF